MKLTGNRVLAEPIRTLKEGRFHLTEQVAMSMDLAKPRLWRVIRVSPKCEYREHLRPGDRILTHSYTAGPIELDARRALIPADQILAVLPQPPPIALEPPTTETTTPT